MSSTFYGLQIARTGVFVSQKGLEVTGHNIANANTPGYTRQRLITSSIEGGMNYGIFTYTSKGQVGGGVDIQELTQIRDAFLDMQYRRESGTWGEWTVKTDALQYIEGVFREPSEAGINAVLADLFEDLHELSKNPESKEIRTLVRQDAIKLTETLRHYYNQLVALQEEQDTAIKLTIDEINDIVKSIRDLNEQIFKYEAGGERANDLRDKRNLLIDELSTLIRVDYYEDPNGRFRIDLNGMPLVDHLSYRTLTVTKSKDNPVEGEANLYSIKWAGTDIELNLSDIRGGKLKGYLEMRDGDGDKVNSLGIPYFVKKLNEFTKNIADAFNYIHSQGYTLPYGDNESRTGINFFTDDADGIENITAKNITVSKDIMESVYNIAASSKPVYDDPTQIDDESTETGNEPTGRGNNEIALQLADLRNKAIIKLKDGREIEGLENTIKSIIADLAVEASHSSKMKEGQEILKYNLETQRLSVSGVSIDEEMTNLIQYQHAYSAAARMITAIDQALDILINRTGVVGR